MRTDDLYLLFQPIVMVETSKRADEKVDEYEVLLRSFKTDTFPFDEFSTILLCPDYYTDYMNWFGIKLEERLQQNPSVVISINFDLDQFQYQATTYFLEYFSKYSDNLIIEITEHFPTRNPELLDSFQVILNKIKQYHYKIAIDDFTEGINTYFLYKKYRSYYDRIKITYRNSFTSLVNIIFLAFYVRIINRIYSKNISIVVERIDTKQKARWMRRLGISHQQGYYWGKGSTES